MSDEEEELGEPEDDKNQDLDCNPFFDGTLFKDPKKKQKEVVKKPSVKKEESTGSTSEEKPLKGPFKEVNEDDEFLKDDWYEPRGTGCLRYDYSEDEVQYILKK